MTDGRQHHNFDKFHWAAVHADEYAPGDSVVLNGKIYVANDAATKGAAVDYSVSPEAGDGSLTSDWVSAETREPIEEYESLADLLAADLPVGAFAETAVHTYVGQGGGALYQIIAADDGYSDASANGFAKIQEAVPDLSQFGALYDDPTFDNLPAFNKIQQHVQRGRFTVSPGNYSTPVSYYTSGTWVLQENRVCEGLGHSSSIRVVPMAGFTDPYLSRVGGTGETTVLNTHFENMTFTAATSPNIFPGVVAAYSNSANEYSGWYHCRLQSHDSYCMHVEVAGGSPKNFNMVGLEFFRSEGNAVPVVSIQLGSGASASLKAATVIGKSFGNVGPNSDIGINVATNTHLNLEDIHIEACNDGILTATSTSSVSLLNINGPSATATGTVVNLVRRSANSYMNARALNKRAATNVLVDDSQGYIFTDEELSYEASDGATDTTYVEHSSNSSLLPRRNPLQMNVGAVLDNMIVRTGNTTTQPKHRNVVMQGGTTVNLHDIGASPHSLGDDCTQEIMIWNHSAANITVRANLTNPNTVYLNGAVVTTATLPARQSMKAIAVKTSTEVAWYLEESSPASAAPSVAIAGQFSSAGVLSNGEGIVADAVLANVNEYTITTTTPIATHAVISCVIAAKLPRFVWWDRVDDNTIEVRTYTMAGADQAQGFILNIINP